MKPVRTSEKVLAIGGMGAFNESGSEAFPVPSNSSFQG